MRGGPRTEPFPTPEPGPVLLLTPAPYTRSFTLPVPAGRPPQTAPHHAMPAGAPMSAQPAVLLRLALHVPAGPAPTAAQVRVALEALTRAITEKAGLTVRLPGGVLGLFGLGGLDPEDAKLALVAGRGARTALAGLPGGLQLRGALDLGPVLAANVGGPDAYELAALGEVAERVERLVAVAGPGELAIGAGVAAAVEGLETAQAVDVGGAKLLVVVDRG
ncbi:MAG: hypothetical protein QM767_03300 [Anaeromyxobacter sp.]